VRGQNRQARYTGLKIIDPSRGEETQYTVGLRENRGREKTGWYEKKEAQVPKLIKKEGKKD